MGNYLRVLTSVGLVTTLLAVGVGGLLTAATYPDLPEETHRHWDGFDKGPEPYPHHPIQGHHHHEPMVEAKRIAKKPAPAPAPAYSAPTQVHQDSFIVDDDDLVMIEQHAPETGDLNGEHPINIDLRALEDIAEVEVRSRIPDGMTYLRSEPEASVEGDELVWRFDRMEEGEVKHLKAYFMPKEEGDFSHCTTAHAVPVACTVTKVGVPRLTIDKAGPEMAQVGDHVTYDIEVSNNGSATAYDVNITDMIPSGMMYKGGDNEAIMEIGALAPGETRRMAITMDAEKSGTHCNTASASASNAASVSDDACTRVVQPAIEVRKSGPARQFVGKSVTYDIMVRNSGDVELTDVHVHDAIDSHTKMMSHDHDMQISSLAPGESKSYQVEVMSDVQGDFCNLASARSHEGAHDEDEACTEWFGHPAILVEVIDTEDPILQGESTKYKIRVTNQGHASDYNVTVNAQIPSELKVLGASGDTRESIQGNSVSFAAYSELEAKQSIEFEIDVEAVSIGDGRLQLEVDSDLLKSPVNEEESTHVY